MRTYVHVPTYIYIYIYIYIYTHACSSCTQLLPSALSAIITPPPPAFCFTKSDDHVLPSSAVAPTSATPPVFRLCEPSRRPLSLFVAEPPLSEGVLSP